MSEADLDFRVAIPARYASTRLPGKPLRLLAGRPLIEHVYRRALASGALEVVIATDDARIREVAEGFGATVCMTAPDHPSGTDRLAEVAARLGWPDDAIVVNVQGDEPRHAAGPDSAGGAEPGDASRRRHRHRLRPHPRPRRRLFDPNAVKVVRDAQDYALYFSRAPIPWHREAFRTGGAGLTELPTSTAWFRHIGLYAYRVAVLRRYPQLPPAPAEQIESLEQLRALWHGIRIYVAEAAEAPPPGRGYRGRSGAGGSATGNAQASRSNAGQFR